MKSINHEEADRCGGKATTFRQSLKEPTLFD